MQDENVFSGEGGETHQDAAEAYQVLTTAHGMPVGDNQNHLRVGESGPLLMEDLHFREKIFHFDHERIPERVVHARGYGAHGTFETTVDLSDITKADIFQRPGEKTPVFVRFSTVVGSRGSADLARDVRGFAVKFYTREGNWDLVGNNIPVFFIQDPIKFPDLVHAAKEEPDRGFPQAQSAHDNFWDFISFTPESMHMIMWVMSDRGLPRSLRFMDGFGVHSFRFVNRDGGSTYVRFHWRPKLGVQSVTWDEAVTINGADPDYHRRDLWQAIGRGDYPEWELAIQTFDEDFASAWDYSVLDPTKLIPEELVPLQVVGRMVLNRTVDNVFAETEQVAFLTQNLVPGIDFTDDPLLQGRNFSYLDTQLKRLGSANFSQLPINAPKCPVHVFHRDGHMAFGVPKGRANYEPNGWAPEQAGPRESRDRGFASESLTVSGPKLRTRPPAFADHYSQARQFYISQSPVEARHLVEALVFELGKVELPAIRSRIVDHVRRIDEAMAGELARRVGVEGTREPDETIPPKLDVRALPSLSLHGRPSTFAGRVLGLVFDEGTDPEVLGALIDGVTTLQGSVVLIGPSLAEVFLRDGSAIRPRHVIGSVPSALFDAVALLMTAVPEPATTMRNTLGEFVGSAFRHCKYIGCSAAAHASIKASWMNEWWDDGCFVLETTESVSNLLSVLSNLRYWQREVNQAPRKADV